MPQQTTHGMPCHIRLAVFFTLGLLAKCFFAAPPPTSRSDASVSVPSVSLFLQSFSTHCSSLGASARASGSIPPIPTFNVDPSRSQWTITIVPPEPHVWRRLSTPQPLRRGWVPSFSIQVIYLTNCSQSPTHLVFSGGPGQSGLKVIAAAGQFLSLGFQGAFDIISWDPRGVGSTL